MSIHPPLARIFLKCIYQKKQKILILYKSGRTPESPPPTSKKILTTVEDNICQGTTVQIAYAKKCLECGEKVEATDGKPD